ncbi:hypothetical protein [Mycobacterium sp.]|uniref:hypothetical protein n=1 Tax=Mycobacterium sp. TaxID=1785 RepID=UPI002C987A80|nr:hypothetical protein [Mycobacterium sp.]HTY33411.1 hypothetical protein [Mycobacterium sp.]
MTESTEKQTVVERVGAVSDEVLESVDASRRAAIAAVRKFVDALGEETPALVDASRRKALIDGGLDLADELFTALIELLRSITRTASGALSSKPGGTKE